VPATLPSFSRGLKLTRFAVFLMLIQIVMGIVTSFKMMGADTQEEAREGIAWLEYVMLANIAAALAMFVGVARAIPEFKRVRMSLTGLVVAALGFAITAAALIWTYHVIPRTTRSRTSRAALKISGRSARSRSSKTSPTVSDSSR
jgi:hypothetical protein